MAGVMLKRMVKAAAVGLCFLGILAAVYMMVAWVPVKYTVKEEDFVKCGDFILLKGNYDTGTGWSIVGDETGFYPAKKVKDVWLEGEMKPPKISVSFGGPQKVYLCKVEKIPEERDIKGEMCQAYRVMEWYPVYPVVREPILLPSWVYPSAFINLYDLSDEPVW